MTTSVVLFSYTRLSVGGIVYLAGKRTEVTGAASAAAKFKRMKPGDRVKLAMEMSSLASSITIQSILDRNPRLSKARLIEEGRKRLQSGRRAR